MTASRLVHLELHTPDQVQASAFYARLLHWRPELIRTASRSYLALELGTGVAERDAGLASGLLNTSQQLGGAIGVAIASTVLTSGFHSAFLVCGVIGLLALPTLALLLGRGASARIRRLVPALEGE